MKVYDFDHYKEYLRAVVEESKVSGLSLSFAKIADAARIQRSYLSQVMAGSNELSTDQIYLVGKFLNLSADENDYLQLLVEMERSSVAERKKQLQAKQKLLKAAHQKSESYLKSTIVNLAEEDVGLYYSDYLPSVVHMFLTIDKFRVDPLAIAQVLGVAKSRVQGALDILRRCNVISWQKNRFHLNQVKIHLPEQHPGAASHQAHFRLKAIESKRDHLDPEGYYFSACFSADEEARVKLKKDILKLIAKFSDEVTACEAKNVFQLNIDLFKF